MGPGFATTNKRVEPFNRDIKRDYTLRARLKLSILIKLLSECYGNESHRTSGFNMFPNRRHD
ncbi:hypothetical protein GQ600_19887 [Phytophthora cactorum]|nr:hypothetical protein GQ600_19887 [Phytophthora cactorum]